MPNSLIHKILLVDDNEDTLEWVKMGGESYSPPFIIHTAHNAQEATKLMSRNAYDAIILDVSLPVVTGTVFGEIIRKESPDIPLALLTNYNGTVTIESAKELKAEYWYKPEVTGSFDNLMNKICNLLAGVPCSEMNKETAPKRLFVEIPQSFIKIGQEVQKLYFVGDIS